MPIETQIWRIDGTVREVEFARIEAEAKLEALLEQDISLIDPGLMLLGRQVSTAFGKLIDLLAIDVEGQLVVVELKRNRTPREIVAQALDYASWVQDLGYDDIRRIHSEREHSHQFEQAFAETFDTDPPETLNEQHRIVIVASELDSASERIISYLSTNYGVPINVVFFKYFREGGAEYLSRTWLIDPTLAEAGSAKISRRGSKETWNGTDFYVSFGEGEHRAWEDARRYGFVSAGQGRWYSNTLSLLFPGARVFACIPKVGYVGVGTVRGPSVPVSEFRVEVEGEETPILEAPLKATNMSDNSDDPDLSEYLVAVDWMHTHSAKDAFWEKGMFANQNSACKLRNQFTLERLAVHFDLED